jgi:hypothetical protein
MTAETPVAAAEPETRIARAKRIALACAPWAGGLFAVGLFALTLVQLSHVSEEALATVRRLSPTVWLVFVLLYVAQPVADQVIFHRLWRLPIRSFGVMLRKVVINEVLFGYSGELYFWVWARRRAGLSEAPFDAIKDVNILSALGGNVLTLILLLVSAFSLTRIDLAHQLGPVLWPGLAMVALTFGVLLFRKRVFSLTRPELGFVAWVHTARMVATTGLTLLLWTLALPQVAFGVWLVVLASRMLLARLPFVANKDLVFANLVLVLMGAGSPAALLLATLAIATLMAHLAVTVIVGAPDLVQALSRQSARQGKTS